MPLLAPRVEGPISPCNRAVIVTGALVGATVEIFANERLVAAGVATALSQVFEISSGFELAPRERVRAFQSLGGERSPEHDDAIEVSLPPGRGEIGKIAWLSRLHECGRCVALVGAFPGARVKVEELGSAGTIGETVTLTTLVRLGLSQVIRSGMSMVATQEACSVLTAGSESPPTHSFMNAVIPPPIIREPLLECARRVYIGGVLEGASVQMRRSDFGELGGCFDHPAAYFELSEAESLRVGATVAARQGYPDCDRWSEFTEVMVQPRDGLPVPSLIPPLCAGTMRVVVRNLVPGAIVRIFLNGTELGAAAASAETDVFLVPPLMEGEITVHQELCGFISADAVVPVSGSIAHMPPSPTSTHDCATIVHVDNTQPNAAISILSHQRGYIGWATSVGNEALVHVPALLSNESLEVVQRICSGETTSPLDVLPLSFPINAPVVGPPAVVNGDRSVRVSEIVTGAIVEIFVNDQLRGVAECGTEIADIPVTVSFSEGDRVVAVQRLCEQRRSSSVHEARRCRGRVRFGLKSLVEANNENFRSQVNAMRNIFRFHGIDMVERGPIELLDLPHLEMFHSEDRDASAELARHRNGLDEQTIAIYMINDIVDTMTLGFNIGGNNFIIVQPVMTASELWATAHEMGHALGLNNGGDHVSAREEGRLMRATVFNGGENYRAALIESELATIERSPFMHPC